MNKTNVLVGAVAVVALFLSFLAISKPAQQIVRETVGSVPGGEFLIPVSFRDSATLGGNVFATTSNGSVTYTAASFGKTSLIQHTASGAVTATLPASSTLSSFAPFPGDVRTIFLNPITTAVTLVAGTGTDINNASTSLKCQPATLCRLDFVRKSNSDFEVYFSPGT